MKDKDYKITISWNVEDVLSLDNTLTIDQCIEVLDMARDHHDANYGISWDTLSYYIDEVKEFDEEHNSSLMYGVDNKQ